MDAALVEIIKVSLQAVFMLMKQANMSNSEKYDLWVEEHGKFRRNNPDQLPDYKDGVEVSDDYEGEERRTAKKRPRPWKDNSKSENEGIPEDELTERDAAERKFIKKEADLFVVDEVGKKESEYGKLIRENLVNDSTVRRQEERDKADPEEDGPIDKPV